MERQSYSSCTGQAIQRARSVFPEEKKTNAKKEEKQPNVGRRQIFSFVEKKDDTMATFYGGVIQLGRSI